MEEITNTINDLLDQLDGSGSESEHKAIQELRRSEEQLPSLLLSKYSSSRKWNVRCACVMQAIRYAKNSDDSIKLGQIALFDKSKRVRYRASMLLAYSLNETVLPTLKDSLKEFEDEETKNNVMAAIDAIEMKNSHLFLDRNHTGKVFMNIR